jgi:Icc protein
MLDTSEPGVLRSRLCEQRLARTAECLADAKGQGLKIVLLLHHNPCALQMPVDTYRLAEPEKLLKVLHESGADIIQILAGHCHITSAGSWGVTLARRFPAISIGLSRFSGVAQVSRPVLRPPLNTPY